MTTPLRFGLLRTSLIDFPARVSAVLFTAGCNFRCPYCHNPSLAGDPAGPTPAEFIEPEEALAFLRRRRPVLGGVVLTGGEPLIHPELPDFVARIRSLGLPVKVDTNGSFPGRLAEAAPDYVAVDVKASPDRYADLTGSRESGATAVAALRRTIAWVLESGVEHEFRTTVAPGIVDAEVFEGILGLIDGADRLVLNQFRPGTTLDRRVSNTIPYPREVLEHFVHRATDRGIDCRIRDSDS